MTTEAMGTETIPQMRERIEAQNKELKTLRARSTELEAETRRLQARDAFRDAGYHPKHGDLYAAQHPEGDISPDGIAGFAQEYNLAPVTPPPAPAPAPGEAGTSAPAETALASMARGGSRPGEGGQPPAGQADRSMTRDAWLELMKSDPAAARKAVQDGRVQIRKDNPFAKPRH